MKKVLILGGTSFVGRNIVEYLIGQPQFEVSLFNRGVSNPALFKDTDKLIGNRDNPEDIDKIFQKEWDFIIDVSCYYPHQLKSILQRNLNNLSNYIFISTCSVYDNEQHQGKLRGEEAPILECSVAQEKDQSPGTYGNRKAACERLISNSGIPHTILRPALIYGQYDPTDRLYYWLYQVNKTQTALVPEEGKRVFSITFIKDLVKAIDRILELGVKNQTFNCISSPTNSISEIIDICEAEYNKTIKKVPASAEFLHEREIPQWSGIPLWLNTDMFTYSNTKLLETLSFEPTSLKAGLKETIRYYNQLDYNPPKFGIDDARKVKLIKELRKG